jgi:dolichol-phosphate mannosyltransferase
LASATLVAVPWYATVAIRHPEFIEYFFWLHNVTRFAQPFDHQAPPWQYLPSLLLGMMPWTLLLIPLVVSLFRHSARQAARRPAALGFFSLSFIWMLVFFSLAGSKRPSYIVPVLPPLALTLGCYLDSLLPREKLVGLWQALQRSRSRIAYVAASLLLVGGVGLALAALQAKMLKPELVLLTVASCSLILAWLLARSRQRRSSWLTPTAITLSLLMGAIHGLLPEYAQRFSLRHSITMQQHLVATSDSPVICYPHRFDAASFYLPKGQVLSFGRAQRPQMVAQLEEKPRTVVIVQTQCMKELVAALPPNLEFVPRQQEALVTIGEVRQRVPLPDFRLAAAGGAELTLNH